MNMNQGKFWTRRIGAQMERKGDANTDMTNGFYVDSYNLFRISAKGAKPDYDAFVFPPEIAGEEWEIIIINHTDVPVPDAFRAEIDRLAKTLETAVWTYDEPYDPDRNIKEPH